MRLQISSDRFVSNYLTPNYLAEEKEELTAELNAAKAMIGRLESSSQGAVSSCFSLPLIPFFFFPLFPGSSLVSALVAESSSSLEARGAELTAAHDALASFASCFFGDLLPPHLTHAHACFFSPSFAEKEEELARLTGLSLAPHLRCIIRLTCCCSIEQGNHAHYVKA